jgi:tetratricopeptide (TPR) repeat protein
MKKTINIKKLLTFLIAFAALFITTTAFGQDFDYHRDFKDLLSKSKDKNSEYYYPKLLERFNSNDSTLTNKDIITLQIGFTANKNYKPYQTIDKEREILELISDKKYEKAIAECDKLLKTNPVNFTALIEKGFAYMKLNKPDASIHKERTMKIIHSIMWSGDGTIDRPYFVLSPIDGQTLIRYIMGGSIGTMGSGSDKNGYFLDILEMKKDDKTVTKYFIIQHATDKMFDK